MTKQVLWKGIDRESLENCNVRTGPKGIQVESVIVGREKNKAFRLDYWIRTNSKWEVMSAELRFQYGTRTQDFLFSRNGRGQWKSSNKIISRFNNCIDIDIPLTPFTNTLPIRRLRLKKGESREIKVLYLDLTEGKISAKKQRYTRLSANTYQYQNVPNDFEAKIKVDAHGLVTHYPGLFSRLV